MKLQPVVNCSRSSTSEVLKFVMIMPDRIALPTEVRSQVRFGREISLTDWDPARAIPLSTHCRSGGVAWDRFLGRDYQAEPITDRFGSVIPTREPIRHGAFYGSWLEPDYFSSLARPACSLDVQMHRSSRMIHWNTPQPSALLAKHRPEPIPAEPDWARDGTPE